jgi:uncharacterized protein YlzI (FlbEa/FlbD family)
MIILTRPGGARVGVNLDLVRWVDEVDGTVLQFLDGAELSVAESMDELQLKVREQRAAVLVAAKSQEAGQAGGRLRVLPGGGTMTGEGTGRGGPGAR